MVIVLIQWIQGVGLGNVGGAGNKGKEPGKPGAEEPGKPGAEEPGKPGAEEPGKFEIPGNGGNLNSGKGPL